MLDKLNIFLALAFFKNNKPAVQMYNRSHFFLRKVSVECENFELWKKK